MQGLAETVVDRMTELITRNQQQLGTDVEALFSLFPVQDKRLKLFASKVPPIPIRDYATRLMQYMHCSPECYVMALMLIERQNSCDDSEKWVPITHHSAHRMLGTAIMIAAKLRDDCYLSLSYYASVIGVPKDELRGMEVAMLTALGFNVYFHQPHYVAFVVDLAQSARTDAWVQLMPLSHEVDRALSDAASDT